MKTQAFQNFIKHRGEYRSLEDWVSYVPPLRERASITDEENPAYNGIEALRDHPDLFRQVKAFLDPIGFSRVAYARNGDSAIVFKTTDGQLVRISVDGHEPPRINHPLILQPILQTVFKGRHTSIRLEIMPAVRELWNADNAKLKEDALPILRKALEDSNLDPFDVVKTQNIGILFDGTPIVIDGGAVEKISGKPIIMDGEHLERWFTRSATNERIWKQHHYFPRILTGEITGLISKEEIRELRAMGHDRLVDSIEREGLLYKEELGAWVSRAAEYQKTHRCGFSEALAGTYKEGQSLIGPSKKWRHVIRNEDDRDPSHELPQH